jgi:mono/diheme cytochrome c family protein
VAVAAGAAIALAGCGTDAGGGVSGAAVFANHCQACHSISGHSAPRQQGGDLRGLRLPRAELLQFTAEMPVLHRRLTERELQAVVSYLQAVEHHR